MKSIGATTSTLVYGGTDGYARLMFWIKTRIVLELGSLTPNVMLQVFNVVDHEGQIWKINTTMFKSLIEIKKGQSENMEKYECASFPYVHRSSYPQIEFIGPYLGINVPPSNRPKNVSHKAYRGMLDMNSSRICVVLVW